MPYPHLRRSVERTRVQNSSELLSFPGRPNPRREGGQAEFLGEPELAAAVGAGAAGHGEALGGVVAGVAAGAEHSEEALWDRG